MNKARDRRRRRERLYLQQESLILADTGVRVGEARSLELVGWVGDEDADGGPPACVDGQGEDGDGEVVCNEVVEDYLERLRTFRTDELGEEPSPEEFGVLSS